MNAGPTINGEPIKPKVPGIEGKRVVPEVPPPAFYQQLHLTLTNPSSREVVAAQFTAHGFSRNRRVITLTDASNMPDLTKTVDIALNVSALGQASRDLSFNRFTAVTSIDLDSVAYADGTTWHAPSPGACSIVPELIMRIAMQ